MENGELIVFHSQSSIIGSLANPKMMIEREMKK